VILNRDVTNYLTTKQAAEVLGFSKRTLEGLRLRGGGPRYLKVGARAVRYRLADLIAFAEADERTSTSFVPVGA
jgi:excisionase family DNA binding protein